MDQYVYQGYVKIAKNEGSEDQGYVKIAKNEGSEDIEIPAEKDGTMLLSTVKAQFPDAAGLKYRSPTGAWRGLRLSENVLDPPMEGWSDVTYYITLPDISLKRKASDLNEASGAKSSKPWSNNYLRDIIVKPLPSITTNAEFKEYFEKTCGELAFHEVKFDQRTNKSRGFGFIRFKTEEAAKLALEGEHTLHGKLLDIAITRKKEDQIKLFIGQLASGTTEDMLREYFGEFGELVDVYIPAPFRSFGFVTFVSKEDGRNVSRKSHMLAGSRLNIRVAESREDKQSRQRKEDRMGMERPPILSTPNSDYSWNAQGSQQGYQSGNFRGPQQGYQSGNYQGPQQGYQYGPQQQGYQSGPPQPYQSGPQQPYQSSNTYKGLMGEPDMPAHLKTMLYTYLNNKK